MEHPRLMRSHPDAASFVEALERCAKDGRAVVLERLSAGGTTYTFQGTIQDVTPAEDRCTVKEVDRAPRSYWIRYLFSVVDADGTKVLNRAAHNRHAEVQAERAQRAEDAQRTLVDTSFTPDAAYVTSSAAGTVDGTINDVPHTFYAFKGRSSKPAAAVVHATSQAAANRCMRLLDAETSTWDVFASFLQSHFLWPSWLTLREAARARAAEIRDGLPVLDASADGWARRDREALYEGQGLTWAAWGPCASLDALEQEPLDYQSLFDLADRVPPAILNLFLIVAYNSVRFFDEIERVDARTLQQFIHHGLAVAQPAPTASEALQTMAIARLRELVTMAGTGYKAKDAASLRIHLEAHLTPQLAREAVRRARYKRYQLRPPPGWTWEQFQFFRADYRHMLDALHQWMFNGWAQPEAERIFRKLA